MSPGVPRVSGSQLEPSDAEKGSMRLGCRDEDVGIENSK